MANATDDMRPGAGPEGGPPRRLRLDQALIEQGIRLGLIALLLYWSFVLVRPFISIVLWSAVITVALYPPFDWLAVRLGGRRAPAAALITLGCLLIIVGPVIWLGLGVVDGLRALADLLGSGALALPPPWPAIKSWPLVGEPLYSLWDQASSNLASAFAKIAPLLKPVGVGILDFAAGTGIGVLEFLAAVIIAGFLFSPAPSLVDSIKAFSQRVAASRGAPLVELTGATIRSVSRGVIGVSLLQMLLAGIGLWIAGVPGASLIAFAVLILGIVQIGPSVVLIPAIIWSWMTQETAAALLFTAYIVPVNLLDNFLRPLLIGRGLTTPILVILIGLIGGTLAHGLLGLFLGPIVLAVAWELVVAWMRADRTA
jgi:predicted PurR-regulated permease PerM